MFYEFLGIVWKLQRKSWFIRHCAHSVRAGPARTQCAAQLSGRFEQVCEEWTCWSACVYANNILYVQNIAGTQCTCQRLKPLRQEGGGSLCYVDLNIYSSAYLCVWFSYSLLMESVATRIIKNKAERWHSVTDGVQRESVMKCSFSKLTNNRLFLSADAGSACPRLLPGGRTESVRGARRPLMRGEFKETHSTIVWAHNDTVFVISCSAATDVINFLRIHQHC